MDETTITLPFTLPSLFGGFAAGEGLAKASPAELALEFVVQDSVLNVLKSGVKEIRVPQSEIDVLRFHRGWFRSRIYVRLKSLKWLAELPGRENNGELTLHVARRDRDRAEEFVRMLSGRGGQPDR